MLNNIDQILEILSQLLYKYFRQLLHWQLPCSDTMNWLPTTKLVWQVQIKRMFDLELTRHKIKNRSYFIVVSCICFTQILYLSVKKFILDISGWITKCQTEYGIEWSLLFHPTFLINFISMTKNVEFNKIKMSFLRCAKWVG